MRPRPLLPIVLLATAVLLGACSTEAAAPPRPSPGPDPTTATTTPRIDLDPERYVLDYASSAEDMTVAAAPSTAGETSADTGASAPDQPGPGLADEDTFVDPGEHGTVAVADRPTSTFGLDVDTGSATIGRTFLDQGLLPPPASVRTEEWVNAFGSGQAGPENAAIGLAVDGATPDEDAGSGRRLLRVGVAARDLDEEDRPPAHLTFVVDTSGSMDIGNRLGLVKASLALVVLHLRDDDTIAIVEYADEAGVVLEPTPVRDAETIVAAIDRLQPSTSTNLEAGLRAGYRLATDAYREDGVNAVVLASDGVANVGTTDPDALAASIQDRAEDGIHLVTVGYGMGNYSDDTMEQLADRGDGFYAYLDTYEQAEALFGARITSLLTVVAGDAKAQVRFDPALVSSYRLLGYENRDLADDDFTDDAVDAGELGAGHRVTALYELLLAEAGGDASAGAVLGTATVRARSAATGEVEEVEAPITVGVLAGSMAEAPADLRLQAAAAAFARWLAAQPEPMPVGEDDAPVGPGDGLAPIDVQPPSTDDPVQPDPVQPDASALAPIRALAAGAAADLDGPLPGSVLAPEDLVALIDLAARATPASGGEGWGG